MCDLYGLDAELAKKAESKYDLKAEKEACQWLETLSGISCYIKPEQTLVDLLRSGVILCKAMQAISPNSIPKAFNAAPKHYLEEHGNINMYLEACIKIGVPSHDLFSLRDVGQTKPDRTIVLQNIFALGRQAQALRAPVPQLGVTFHKTMEDLANIEARRLVEREKQMKRRTDEQKRGSDRRQELEGEKRRLTEAKTLEIKAKMARRQNERQERGRDKLAKRSTKRNDSELERSPSPVRFGMDLEHANRMAQKSNALAAEEAVLDWIEDIVHEEVDDLYLHLKSGRTLCRLINALNIGINLKYSERATGIHEMGNIKKFLESLAYFNIKADEAFDVQDLYSRRNLLLVVKTLLLLSNKVELLPGYHGPKLVYVEKPPELHSDPNLAAYLERRAAEKAKAGPQQEEPLRPEAEPEKPKKRGWGWLSYLSVLSVVVGVCAGYYYRHELSGHVTNLLKRYDVNVDFDRLNTLANWRSHLPLALLPYFGNAE